MQGYLYIYAINVNCGFLCIFFLEADIAYMVQKEISHERYTIHIIRPNVNPIVTEVNDICVSCMEQLGR